MNRLTVVVVPIFAAALLAAPNINGAGHRAWRVLSGWIVAGFLLQAAALSTGALAVVEPILIVELPLTLVLAGVVFGQHLHGREWTVTAAITLGLTGVLYFLSLTGETGSGVPALTWIIGIAVNVAVVGVLVAVARLESSSDPLAAGCSASRRAQRSDFLWGVLAFGEGLRGGVNLALVALCAIALGWGVVRLSHSPVWTHSPATDAE